MESLRNERNPVALHRRELGPKIPFGELSVFDMPTERLGSLLGKRATVLLVLPTPLSRWPGFYAYVKKL